MSYCKLLILLLLACMGYAEISFKEKVKAEKHGTAFLHCNSSGNDFSWSKSSGSSNGKIKLQDKLGKYTIFPNKTLKIENVTSLDVGVYNCRVTDRTLTNIFVQLEMINTETIISGVKSNVNLTCKADVPNNQKITDVVYKFYAFHSNGSKILLSENGKLIKGSKKFVDGLVAIGRNVLQINGIEKRTEGKLLCTVIWKSEHQRGHSEYFFNVAVYEKSTKSPTLEKKDDPKAKESGKKLNSCGKKERGIWCLAAALMFIFVVK